MLLMQWDRSVQTLSVQRLAACRAISASRSVLEWNHWFQSEIHKTHWFPRASLDHSCTGERPSPWESCFPPQFELIAPRLQISQTKRTEWTDLNGQLSRKKLTLSCFFARSSSNFRWVAWSVPFSVSRSFVSVSSLIFFWNRNEQEKWDLMNIFDLLSGLAWKRPV